MTRIKFFIALVILVLFSIKIYPNDYSSEANYIFKNHVEISLIDSFFFVSKHSFEEKKFVTLTLINYKSEVAKNLFLKLLNDESFENQSLSIIPLINIGEFRKGFSKFEELILNNHHEILFDLYEKKYISEFTNTKLKLFKKYKSEFIPLLKKVCDADSLSYEIKINAANTLYYLGEKEQLRKISIEILENVPDPCLSSKEYKNYLKKEERYWHLRNKAKWKLENLFNNK